MTYIGFYTVLLGLLFISKAEHDNSLHNLEWLYILNLVIPLLQSSGVPSYSEEKWKSLKRALRPSDLIWPHHSSLLAHAARITPSFLLFQVWLPTSGLHIFCSFCLTCSSSRYAPDWPPSSFRSLLKCHFPQKLLTSLPRFMFLHST